MVGDPNPARCPPQRPNLAITDHQYPYSGCVAAATGTEVNMVVDASGPVIELVTRETWAAGPAPSPAMDATDWLFATGVVFLPLAVLIRLGWLAFLSATVRDRRWRHGTATVTRWRHGPSGGTTVSLGRGREVRLRSTLAYFILDGPCWIAEPGADEDGSAPACPYSVVLVSSGNLFYGHRVR